MFPLMVIVAGLLLAAPFAFAVDENITGNGTNVTNGTNMTNGTGSMVTVCHDPSGQDRQTLQVNENALNGHLAHGDTMGACPNENGTGGNGTPPPSGQDEMRVMIMSHTCPEGNGTTGSLLERSSACPASELPSEPGDGRSFDFAVVNPSTFRFETIAQATQAKHTMCGTGTNGSNGTEQCLEMPGYLYEEVGSEDIVILETKPPLGTRTVDVVVDGPATVSSSLSVDDGNVIFLDRTGNGSNSTGRGLVTVHVFHVPEPMGEASVTVAPYYPQGADYVYACNATVFDATRFSWDFGDNESQSHTRNQRVFHRYDSDGTYTVTCTADNGRRVAEGTLTVTVTGAGNGTPGNGSTNGTGNGTGNGTNATADRTYQVVVENLMPGQPLSPLAMATHASPLFFEQGQLASQQLETLAETGNNMPLLDSVRGAATEAVSGPPLRGMGTTPNESTTTLTIAARAGDTLSLATMLGCTNDGFAGLRGVALPESGSLTYELNSYDAGTEENTELSEDIPDGCNLLGPVAFPDDGDNEAGIDTTVEVGDHAGLDLDGNLTSAHEWADPVARVTITRLDGTSGNGSTNGTGNETPGNGTGNGTGNETPEETTFSATLSGAQEVPPTNSTATGNVTATLNGTTLSLIGSFTGLSENLTSIAGSPAHIHVAPAGAVGPVVVPLVVIEGGDLRSGVVTLTTTLDEAQRQDLVDGEMYVNIHTLLFPEGEIRGQLVQDNGSTT